MKYMIFILCILSTPVEAQSYIIGDGSLSLCEGKRYLLRVKNNRINIICEDSNIIIELTANSKNITINNIDFDDEKKDLEFIAKTNK